uniref:Uncharacterized protein n=1 Tax=Caenorhabditis japonica TaxID=281687 RepID=A0A8R1DXA3_CAEJA
MKIMSPASDQNDRHKILNNCLGFIGIPNTSDSQEVDGPRGSNPPDSDCRHGASTGNGGAGLNEGREDTISGRDCAWEAKKEPRAKGRTAKKEKQPTPPKQSNTTPHGVTPCAKHRPRRRGNPRSIDGRRGARGAGRSGEASARRDYAVNSKDVNVEVDTISVDDSSVKKIHGVSAKDSRPEPQHGDAEERESRDETPQRGCSSETQHTAKCEFGDCERPARRHRGKRSEPSPNRDKFRRSERDSATKTNADELRGVRRHARKWIVLGWASTAGKEESSNRSRTLLDLLATSRLARRMPKKGSLVHIVQQSTSASGRNRQLSTPRVVVRRWESVARQPSKRGPRAQREEEPWANRHRTPQRANARKKSTSDVSSRAPPLMLIRCGLTH